MAKVFADRVRESTTTTGTGSYTLAGSAPTGYRTFAAGVVNTNTCYYCVTDGTNWEVTYGTLSAGTTLSRDTVLSSSNAGAAVNWGAGTKDVFVTIPGAVQESDVAGPASSANNSIALFDGLTGKLIKQDTTTGLLKAVSGVIGAVVSGTDIKTVNGNSLLGSGDITVTSADPILTYITGAL